MGNRKEVTFSPGAGDVNQKSRGFFKKGKGQPDHFQGSFGELGAGSKTDTQKGSTLSTEEGEKGLS